MANLEKEITVNAAIENTQVVLDFVDEGISSFGASPRAQAQIDVAIDELFSNIAKFAYHPELGKATIKLQIIEEPLTCILTFMDNGRPFNPLENLEPDLSPETRANSIGGLGIFIVRKTMDEVSYEYRDHMNIFTIKKNLKA